jgi:hypothetical protein
MFGPDGLYWARQVDEVWESPGGEPKWALPPSQRHSRQPLSSEFYHNNPKTHERRSTMPSTQNAATNPEYRNVPITVLVESASNPRKRFDEKSIEELAASFKTQL